MNTLISWIFACMVFCAIVRFFCGQKMKYNSGEHLLVVITSPVWVIYFLLFGKKPIAALFTFMMYHISGKPYIERRQVVLESDVYELFNINYNEIVIIKNQVCRLVDVCEITSDIEVYYEFAYITCSGVRVHFDSNIPFITLKGKISDDDYARLDALLPNH